MSVIFYRKSILSFGKRKEVLRKEPILEPGPAPLQDTKSLNIVAKKPDMQASFYSTMNSVNSSERKLKIALQTFSRNTGKPSNTACPSFLKKTVNSLALATPRIKEDLKNTLKKLDVPMNLCESPYFDCATLSGAAFGPTSQQKPAYHDSSSRFR